MFTGLVEEVGVVRRLERRGDGGRLSVRAAAVLEGTRIGDSVAVSGACLTVVELQRDGFTVDCMPETLSLTTLGSAVSGDRVNLERSLAVGGRAGGHLVLGHVDVIGRVLSVRKGVPAWELGFSLPEPIAACVAPKGSIAIDGVSLTVIRLNAGGFDVGVIPHTLEETTLGLLSVGSRVNLEADVLARYVQRALEVQVAAGNQKHGVAPGGLTEELLREEGFV
jgi:riboflavin synthase